MKTLSDIDAMLDRLRRRLEVLLEAGPRETVLDTFSEEAQPLIEQVPEAHDAYVQDHVHRMLVAAKLIADESPTG
ncbi:MAG: hypothetical protein ABW163_00330 [Luteimonas sp.]